MKKVGLLALLTCVVAGHYVSFLTLLSHWSVTSKVICLMLFSCAFSSAALMALAWALRDTWSTTHRQDSLNRLATLAKKEREILATKLKATQDLQTFDLWEELHEQDMENIRKAVRKDFRENLHKL